MNSIDNLIKTICIILNIEPLDGSYVDALGVYFNVVDQPEKPYNREVLVAALVNGVAPGTSEVLLFDTYNDFPAVGDDSALYVAKDSNIIYRFDDVLSTYVILNDPDTVDPDAPEEGGTFYVRLATTTALNACTYNNGTAGDGATLTGNVNGILGEIQFVNKIDNVSAVLGDVILIKNQASTLQNGIYEVTQLGSVSLPFILTRISGYNETDEVYPSIVFVSAGSNNINRYFTQSTVNPVIGTNGLVYAVAATSQSALPSVFVDSVTSVALPTVVYANGTTYAQLPGNGATLTATVNGALGVIGGVTMTSGLRLIVKDQANQAHNGVYTVTNAGSASQKFKLTRLVSDSNSFYRVREYIITNPNCVEFGGRYTISSPLSMANSAWGTTNIIFSKQNNVGLRQTDGRIILDSTNGSNDSYLRLDGGASHNAKLFSTGDVDITADNGVLNLNGSIQLNGDVNITTTDGFDTRTLSIDTDSNGVRLDVDDFGLQIIVNNGDNGLRIGQGSVSLTADVGQFNAYAGPTANWYLGDYDENKGFIKRTAGVGTANEIKIHAGLGTINLSSGYVMASGIPSYANDGAADADTDLPTGGIYKLNGNRTLFQKP